MNIDSLLAELKELDIDAQVEAINSIKLALHEVSPFRNEPVDCVLWIKGDDVKANDYNPNKVAPPEMELLRTSIDHDGYTQPIVTMPVKKKHEVIDGFHRNRVGKECEEIKERIHGYLPVVEIRNTQADKNNRIASTIRHNRARGKHQVDAMSDIVIELKRRNWTNSRICRELGMEEDEILRLCQVTGLSDLFNDQDFSKSWDVEGDITEADYKELSDDVETYGDEKSDFRTVNTSDENRIFHKYDKWECYKAGFYKTTMDGMTKPECEQAYCDFLSDIPRFESALNHIISNWKYSCEHYLTNESMNRIAWLGQASMCHATGVPACFRGGYFLLTPEQQDRANRKAHEYLNKWLKANDRPEIEYDNAVTDRQSDIY